MLKKLVIDQFVIIEHQVLDFKDRLTILTGQTGAGKSILLSAMALILGGPSTPKSTRAGHDESKFEAVMAPPKTNKVWDILIQEGFASSADEEFIIKRTMRPLTEQQVAEEQAAMKKAKENKKKYIPPDNGIGNDIVTINDKPVTLTFLKEIGIHLVEIHGQFANQELLKPSNQLFLLDAFGAFDEEYFDNVKEALDRVKKYKNLLDEEKLFLAKHKGRVLKRIEDIIAKFESINMRVGLIEEVKAEYATLLTARDTMEAFQRILGRLISANGIVVSLSGAKETLNKQENLEEDKMVNLHKYLDGALDNARKAVDEMNTLVPEYEIDLDPITKCEEILRTLKSIGVENKVPFENLEKFFVDMDTKLKRVRNGRNKLEELDAELRKAKEDYRQHAHILHEKRVVAGKELSEVITAELPPLKLEKAQFEVEVKEDPKMAWTEKGFDKITFTARMNPGSPFTPISETASGGELARMILGLKVVLQEVQMTPTLVFDEVDTGIGGNAAAAVGERLAMLSDSTQVLVITHSPQVASRGEQHLHIMKKSDDEQTISSVHELVGDERIDELSRMLAGAKLTDASRAAAESLINEAVKSAKERRAEKANA
jgi:DNA repair protein RecN (Recombination protein N)